MTRHGLPLADRFWMKVDQSGECWTWTASRHPDGYGKIKVDGAMRWAHRVAYELEVGPILEDLVIDHLCRNRLCVNPNHLEAVSRWENVRRGEGWTAEQARKTHCKRGHEFTEANTYRWRTSRMCRACRASRAA